MLCDLHNPEIRSSEHLRRLHHMEACEPQDMLGQGHVGQVVEREENCREGE